MPPKIMPQTHVYDRALTKLFLVVIQKLNESFILLRNDFLALWCPEIFGQYRAEGENGLGSKGLDHSLDGTGFNRQGGTTDDDAV